MLPESRTTPVTLISDFEGDGSIFGSEIALLRAMEVGRGLVGMGRIDVNGEFLHDGVFPGSAFDDPQVEPPRSAWPDLQGSGARRTERRRGRGGGVTDLLEIVGAVQVPPVSGAGVLGQHDDDVVTGW